MFFNTKIFLLFYIFNKTHIYVGALTRTRTANLLITNQLLYQLSYEGLREYIGQNKLFFKSVNETRKKFSPIRLKKYFKYRNFIKCLLIFILYNEINQLYWK